MKTIFKSFATTQGAGVLETRFNGSQKITTMTWNLPTSRLLKGVAAVLVLLMAGLATSGQARAGCSDGVLPVTHQQSVRFTPAVYRPDQANFTAFTPVGDEGNESASIVGLWEFEVHLKGAQNGLPDNALFDWGLATWHDDGTEIQFSAGRPPSAGDVCMGAWQQVGRSKFKLHHIALGLTPPASTGTFVGPAIISANVTVDPSGSSYSGQYTISVYPGSPDNGTEFNESGAPLVTFIGTITAKRVTAN
jgi:hypothetical protein